MSFAMDDAGLGAALAHVSLIPILISILRGSGLFSLWLFGSVFGALYFSWLHVFSILAPVVMTLLHGFWIVLGLASCLWLRRRRPDWQVFLAACIFWPVAEYLRALGPYGHEWGSLGYTQYGSLRMSAFASVGGVWLISLLVLISNALLALAWHRKDQRWLGAAAIYAVAVWFLSPFDRLPSDIVPAKEFVAVQTNVSPYIHPLERETVMREQLKALADQAALLRGKHFILPETLFSTEIVGMRGYLTEEPRDLLAGFRVGHPDRQLLVGAIERDTHGFYNSAILFNGQGARVGSYRKRHLVPFGESIPGFENNRWARAFGEKLGTPFFSAGDTHAPLLFGAQAHRAAVLICYEGTFTRLVAKAAPGADILINISNDAWTGSKFGHDQHLRFLRFRAVETGLPVIRVGNSGPTALFAPNGRLVSEVSDDRPAILDFSRE